MTEEGPTSEIVFRGLTDQVLDRIGDKKMENVDAIATPFPSWNDMCGEEGGQIGLAKGWLVVLAGIPGTGKSTLALNLATHAVLKGKKVGVINFEMSMTGMATRYLSILSGENKWELQRGKHFNLGTWERAKERVVEVAEETGGVLITNESAVFTLDDIDKAYQLLVDRGCEMVIIDYVQLVEVGGVDGIFQRTNAVANRLRFLTHKNDVVTIALSQFNRDTSKKRDAPPQREGLSGGSPWENNSNQIVLLDHSIRRTMEDENVEYTQLIADKNRHGRAPFVFPIRWEWDCMRCEEYSGDLEDVAASERVTVADDEPEAEIVEPDGSEWASGELEGLFDDAEEAAA